MRSLVLAGDDEFNSSINAGTHGKKVRSPAHDRMGKARYAGASAQLSAASMRTQGVSPRSDAAARLTPKIETRPPTTRRSMHRAL